MKLRLREIHIGRHRVCWDIILSTDRGMISARNAMYAHAQDFWVYDELLLPILSEFAQNTPSLHAFGILDVFGLHAVAEQSIAPSVAVQ
jgi:hypothetical protein